MKKYLLFFIIIIFTFACVNEKPDPPEINYNNHILPQSQNIIHKIAFSSGCKQYRSQLFWDKISTIEPDLWIWGGDNIYSDTEDINVLKSNYSKLKKNEYYQEFIKEIPVIGVWDDHDYGARDGGEDYILKEESKDAFLDFFDIPEVSSIRQHNGIYTSYELGEANKKVKIYLLDNRTFKTELTLDTEHENYYIPDMNGTVLGSQQWQWLEHEIRNSNSEINIFVSGIQIIPDEHIFEKWGNFPNERQKFLDLLEQTNVKNPIILSGDRHFAEFSVFNLTNGSKVLELTASGLTHSYDGVVESNIYRKGSLYDKKNFGIINIEWKDNSNAQVDIIISNVRGEEISKWSYDME